jgi:glutamate synthase (NADPH/NADH) large chain
MLKMKVYKLQSRICEEAAQAFVMAKPYWFSDKKIREGFLPANAALATGAVHHY